MKDMVSLIMAYEEGTLEQEDIVGMFQEMINSGLVWHLQGHYGRTARRLIDEGFCYEK